jgi:hypothetical protein
VLVALDNPRRPHCPARHGGIAGIVKLIDPGWMKMSSFGNILKLVSTRVIKDKLAVCQFLLLINSIWGFFAEEQNGSTSE